MSKTRTAKKPATRKPAKSAKAAPKKAASKKAAPKGRASAKPTDSKAATDGKAKKLSAIDAAAKVLGEAKGPMTTKDLIDAIAAKGYWKSPGGKTPDRTLYSAILREIATKGKEARFQKTERGKFALKS